MLRRCIRLKKERISSPPSRVKVFVRIRPLRTSDVRGHDGKGAVDVGDSEMTKIKVVEGKTERVFEFDHIIPQEAGNDQVYRIVGKPLVEACLTGLNGILMAYGQTGAGKTYTLMAPNGITSSIVNTIFSVVERDQIHSYTVTCSYLQIYQERIYDLLSAGKIHEVFLREHPKRGIYVERLSEVLVRCPDEVAAFLSTGKKRLAFAETKMNRHSSRSHAIFQIKIERLNLPSRYGVMSLGEPSRMSTPSLDASYRSKESLCNSSDVGSCFDYEEDDDVFSKVTTLTEGAATVRGRLYICDLAGSERVKKTKAQGERLHEAQCINSSLLELGNVIHALAEGKRKHIPFRNSVLTRFLQDGLAGNSKTSLIVCASPSYTDVNETLCSLKFGLRAMKVECTAQVNIEIDYEKMARQLAETLETKEREWRRLKTDYESYIMSLKTDRESEPSNSQKNLLKEYVEVSCTQGLPLKTQIGPWQKIITGPVEEGLKNQTKALLLAELISMELFYGMEDLLRDDAVVAGKEVPTEKLYSLTDRDLLLHSAETLLELTDYFFTKSTFCAGENGRANATEKSYETGIAAAGEPVAGAQPLHGGYPDPSYAGKLLRVRGTLCRIKETTDGAAVRFLTRLLEQPGVSGKGVDSHKRRLHELLREYLKSRVSPHDIQKGAHDLAEVLNLEQTLCHVLMDKALVNCILLLDKAEMEKKLKQLKEEHSRFEYTGGDTLLVTYRKKSSEESSMRSDGRLISVDEGVVLEGSESTNSREKLSTPLESSSLAEMEAENRALCENNARMRRRLDDSERLNESLNLKFNETEEKLRQAEMAVSEIVDHSSAARNELQKRFENSEFQKEELTLRNKDLEDRLRESELRFSIISDTERKVRFEVSEDLYDKVEKAKAENSCLVYQVQDLEDKLVLSSDSQKEKNSKLTKELGDAISENGRLSLKVVELKERVKTNKGAVDIDGDVPGQDMKKLLGENKRLVEEIVQLGHKLKEAQNEVYRVGEEERKIREDLCEQMVRKLTSAQKHSEDLGKKILVLEVKLQKAEQYFVSQKGVEKTERQVARNELKELKYKLGEAEGNNIGFCAQVREIERKLHEVGKLLTSKKENELSLQKKLNELEGENLELRRQSRSLKEKEGSSSESETTEGDHCEYETSSFLGETQMLKEAIVGLETQILVKDQEILCLKNEIVDLMSEVGKLDGEYNELVAQRVHLENDMKEQRAAKDEVEGELQCVLKECAQLRNDVLTVMVENKSLRDKIEGTSKVIKTSVTAVLNERAALEKDLASVQEREKDLENTLSNSEALNTKLQLGIEQREETISKLQIDLDALLNEKSKLEFAVSELREEHVNTSEDNDALQYDLSKLERNLSTLQESLTFCLREKRALVQEMAIKTAEVETLRTYASLCSEETKSMKSQIELYRETEDILQSRVDELEESFNTVNNESIRMKIDLNSIEEERMGLEKRIQEASRAIDRVKEELITLMQTVLALQKELLCLVDSILICLGLDNNHLQATRQRLVSSDSGYISNNTETCSERSSEGSDTNFASSLTACYLVPDEECLVNPSEISIIRENKSEIFRMHEELKIKLFIIKDALDRFKETQNPIDSEVAQTCDSNPNIQFSSGDSELSMNSNMRQVKEFPYLNKAERAKLTNLIAVLKREGTNNDGKEVYNLYSRLEGKLSGLSSQLASKEIEICRLLKEKMKLHDELMKNKYGISLCEHCLNDPEKLEQSNELLRANLFSYMEDTAKLEGDIMDFAEYKAKLEEELNTVREQITELEDEIGACDMINVEESTSRMMSVIPDRTGGGQSPERKISDTSNTESTSSCTDSTSGNDESKATKSRAQKRVTFEQMAAGSEVKPILCRRKHRQEEEKIITPVTGTNTESVRSQMEQPEVKVRKLDEQCHLNSSDVDLCKLLESIPLDVPLKVTEEEKKLEESVNRLSEYDNMSFGDKVDLFVQRQNSETTAHAEKDPILLDVDGRSDPVVRINVDASNCKMCGLIRKKKVKDKDYCYNKKDE